MDYLLGLDIGTSGVKALLLHQNGQVVGSATVDYPLYSPQPGWSEQNPEELWEGTIKVIQKIIKQFDVDPKNIKGIGLSGQMHSAVFLDENLAVIRPAILWNDTRTKKQCQTILESVGADCLMQEACNPPLEGFTAPKVLWLKDNEPDNYRKVCHLLLPKDYIRYRLTGNINMELSDAAGTLLLNVRNQEWSENIVQALDIPRSILPPIVGSSQIAGCITKETAQLTGLIEGTPVVGGGADNACGAVGAGVVREGRAMVSLGTSGVMLAHLDQAVLLDTGTIHMFNSAVENAFYMMGVILSAGLSLRWFKEQLGDGLEYENLTTMAKKAKPGSKSLLFLPYLSGERTPHGDANARGVYLGLTNSHTKAEMVRAVLEGVAFAFQDSLNLLRQAGWKGNSVRAIGGGAKDELWREIIASVTGLEVETLSTNEGPALGAAILAGVGVGTFSSVIEASDKIIWPVSKVHPNLKWQEVYSKMYSVYRNTYPALKPIYQQLVD
jgi:xylulokinase